MRILHVANFAYNSHGGSWYNCDRKISAGFTRNGHFVYDFSLRDMARMGTIWRSKRLGGAWANAEVKRLCEALAPDLLLLGHAQLLDAGVLGELRRSHPDMRIAFWYVDPLFHTDKTAYIAGFAPYLDAAFATTGGEWLQSFTGRDIPRGFMPNPVDPAVESLRNFERQQFDHELIYCGTVGDDKTRGKFMQDIATRLADLPLRFQGLLGQPGIDGAVYLRALAGSRMGLNHSRRNDVTLYSSDRLAQLTGNGLLTLTPRVPGLELLYTGDEVAYFDSLDELVDKVRHFHAHPREAARLAEAGWRRAHATCNASRIARYMEELTFGRPFSEAYEWQAHVFRPAG